MQTTSVATTIASPRRDTTGIALDDLLVLDANALETLYRTASVPLIEDVRGDLRGRMLAVVDLPKPLIAPVRAFASASFFPWRGKSFDPKSPAEGTGINRIVSDGLRLFRFETGIGRSRAGAFDALHLDYDHDENPWLIRQIEDEIRELRPGLWLGQAYIRVRREPHRARLALYFGLALS
jgi:hypothetical protein